MLSTAHVHPRSSSNLKRILLLRSLHEAHCLGTNSSRFKLLMSGPYPAISTVDSEANRVCPACFNLDPTCLPKKLPQSILNEYAFQTSSPAIETSAEKGHCKYCGVLSIGLGGIQNSWSEEGDEDLVRDESAIIITMRPGHSLRVRVSNPDIEVTYEFYTTTPEGS